MSTSADLPDPQELTALPPLSPTMERAFSEAFADMSELEKSEDATVIKLETPEIRSMSPSGSKKQTAKDSVEAKRARRSAIEKKSRQRRQSILKRMRDELQQKYSELTLVAHALEEDQEDLQKLLQQHEEFQKAVRSLSDEDMEERNRIWDTGVPPSASFKARFKTLTMAECYALVRESHEEIQRFSDAEHFETTGANFMGWTDKRKYDSRTGSLQYAFTKKFPLESPEGLLMSTWDIFLDASKFKDMSFDRSVNTRYQVLQQMNDDLRIVRRDHRIPNIEMTFATVQIIFRLQTPTGYTLCMRTIPAPEIQGVQDQHEYFYDVYHWTHFNRLYDEFGNPAGCEIVAAGSIADQNQLKSTYWLFELVCSILRWETACVAPLFLKQI
ncbi:uncharacterized protein PITG_10473 [Phytophthora infestans T30-4]|uniref:Uncharacterized protein n=1 Tax=Phytophthora infestans (strain T30-4) TaxID=403677 RepID=D0NFE1_PHYIT|nr:uncharacterized protein PITG_10473 [Phytophthora infestans T30-4]EEY56930.1 conserved hypothetical protein [Phytophthora infestans T30-4]|eukprot:XP_002902258.1 conserved hypothetical protein [Phytophthora infestans T30-4]